MWIYEKTEDNSSRFILGNIGSRPPMLCFGVNPSTAAPEKLDNTVRKVENFAHRLGYDGWIMLNLYPQRATDPNDLHMEVDKNLHETNIKFIKHVVNKYKPTLVWAAWGTLIHKRNYFKTLLKDICEKCDIYGIECISFGGLTKEGHPRHPLYLANNSEKYSFDMRQYVEKLA